MSQNWATVYIVPEIFKMVWDPQDVCCLLWGGDFEGRVSEEALEQPDVRVDCELRLGSCQLVGGKEGGVRKGLTTPLLVKGRQWS